MIEILREDLRCAEARRSQRAVHRHEGAHVLGEMSDAAVGLAVADRRAVRLARRIHQDLRGYRGRVHATGGTSFDDRVTSCRRIALQIADVGALGREAVGEQEGVHCDEPVEARCPGAGAGQRYSAKAAAFPAASRWPAIGKRNVEPLGRQPMPARSGHSTSAIRPSGFRRIPARPSSSGAVQPIEVEMRDRHARCRVALHQREGRARHLRPFPAPSPGSWRAQTSSCRRRGRRYSAIKIARPRGKRQLLRETDAAGGSERCERVRGSHAASLYRNDCGIEPAASCPQKAWRLSGYRHRGSMAHASGGRAG